MKVSKSIIALFLVFAIAVGNVMPVVYAATGNVLLDAFNEMTFEVMDDVIPGSSALYSVFLDWWHGTAPNSAPKYGIGGGTGREDVIGSGAQKETVYNSGTTQRYQVLNTTNNTWYNPVTNNYITYNSITRNNEYNVYNISNDTYNAYITNNYTYVSYYIIDNETESTWYYEIYYQLPDGRNTWNMTKEEVWGLGLSYDPVNYDFVAEDSGVVGLWHFDGDLRDSSAKGTVLQYNTQPGYATGYNYIDSPFNSALSFKKNGRHQLNANFDVLDRWTVEGRMKFDLSGLNLPTSVTATNDGSSGVTLYSGQYASYSLYELAGWAGTTNGDAARSLLSNSSLSVSWGCADLEESGYYDWYDQRVGFVYDDQSSSVILHCPVYVKTSSGMLATFYVQVPVTYNVKVTNRVRCWKDASGTLYSKYTWESVEITDIAYGTPTFYGQVFDDWFSFAVVSDGTVQTLYINGVAVDVANSTAISGVSLENAVSLSNGNCVVYWDELRVTDRVLYSQNYVPQSQPFDTNKVYVLPETGMENQIAVRSSIPVSLLRVGGVRPTYPSDGYLYVYLENGTVMDVQQYQLDGWYSVDAAIYKSGEWRNLRGMDLTDISVEKPEGIPDDTEPDEPGDSGGDSGTSSDTESAFSKTLDSVLSAIIDLVADLAGLVLKTVFGLFGWLTDFVGWVNTTYLGGFFPAAIWGPISILIPLIIVLGLIRFVRGFF